MPLSTQPAYDTPKADRQQRRFESLLERMANGNKRFRELESRLREFRLRLIGTAPESASDSEAKPPDPNAGVLSQTTDFDSSMRARLLSFESGLDDLEKEINALEQAF